jgi:hypothetical protein
MGRSLMINIGGLKFGDPICDYCDDGCLSIARLQYQHPNGERYWINVCGECRLSMHEWEVKS